MRAASLVVVGLALACSDANAPPSPNWAGTWSRGSVLVSGTNTLCAAANGGTWVGKGQ